VIGWLAPAALAGLLAVAGPIAVHLLRRQRARRFVIPSVRFIPEADRSAVRWRHPSDALLLLLRVAIVACAAVALARPLVLHSGRTAAWAERTARVVIVDASDSARGMIGGDAIAAEMSAGDPVLRIDASDPGGALKRAAAWLAQSPPARREIVVLSDFQAGAVTEEGITGLPPEIGVRLVPFGGEQALQREVAGATVLTMDGIAGTRVRLDGSRTAASYTITGAAPEGLQIMASAQDADAVARLLRVVSAAGALAPWPAQPIVIRFPGAGPLAPSLARGPGESGGPGEGGTGPAASWTFAAAQRFLRSTEVSGLPVRIGPRGPALVVEADADPRSLEAAQLVKAALDARVDAHALAEHEPARIGAATLARWSRAPAPPEAGAWRQSEQSDGRWFWLTALVLIGAESVVRRSPAAASRRPEAHAA
jgi:hypothetical protein